MIRLLGPTLILSFVVPAFSSDKLTDQERVDLVRSLTAEYATVKETLPRTKKPLELESTGKYDQAKWAALIRENGPAARLGDQVQITKVTIERERILFDINGGNKNAGHWYDHVEVGMGGPTRPMGHGDSTARTGTYLALEFHRPLSELDSITVKKLLAPLFDFEKHSVTTLYFRAAPARN